MGEAEPAGRSADEPNDGFWWLYAPFRFDDFAIVLVLQESPDGFRTLNDAIRIDDAGHVEQLGWPQVGIAYEPGTRHPVRAHLVLTRRDGTPLELDIEPLAFVALHVGCGYGGDPEWSHGQWLGRDHASVHRYDYTEPDVANRVPWGVLDHVAKATCGRQVGYGLFEHAALGRHDPSGFADWFAVAGEA